MAGSPKLPTWTAHSPPEAAGAGVAADWLRLFILEKAFYELRYELNNRPQNAAIPMRGLLQVLEPETVAQDLSGG